MMSKNDLPSPFLTFWIVISALCSVFVYFVENKSQSLMFYFSSFGFLFGESLLCAFLVWRVKSSTAGIIFISDDDLFEKGMRDRKIARRKKLLEVTFVFLITICILLAGVLVLKNMYTSS